nr:NADH dehydrogenase subunit 3 [Acostemma sp.]
MYMLIKSTIVIIMLIIIISTLILSMGKKTNTNIQKVTPFECGFNSITFSRLPFSIHFFLIAVIFLIFDIEIIIIMPLMLTMKTSMIIKWMSTSILFISILIVGLYHEWINGMINWSF